MNPTQGDFLERNWRIWVDGGMVMIPLLFVSLFIYTLAAQLLIAITARGQIVHGGREIGVSGVRPLVRLLTQKENVPVVIQVDENASAAYSAAIRKFPDFPRAHKHLGLAYVQKGLLDEAIISYTRALELGGEDGNVHGVLGYCHLIKANYFSAEAAYRKALLFAPANLDWKLGIARCLLAQQEYHQAASLFEELIQQIPDNLDFWLHQANNTKSAPSPNTPRISSLKTNTKKLGASCIKSKRSDPAKTSPVTSTKSNASHASTDNLERLQNPVVGKSLRGTPNQP